MAAPAAWLWRRTGAPLLRGVRAAWGAVRREDLQPVREAAREAT